MVKQTNVYFTQKGEKMKLKKLESGRSMVEMLGVLAIVGILSIGGIGGYSLSMRKHRANQVVDTASKYAVVAYNHCQQKILNGEATVYPGYTGYIDGCDGYTDSLFFKDAGLGNAPAGVHIDYPAAVEHNSTTGDDTVRMSIDFDDDKLCQAVAAISGVPCYPDPDHEYSSETAILFKQN